MARLRTVKGVTGEQNHGNECRTVGNHPVSVQKRLLQPLSTHPPGSVALDQGYDCCSFYKKW